MANPARAYLATQVETTSQGELLVMLYEAAIKFLKRAKIEIENKDYAKKGIYISKAMAIIHELTESLNKEKGGNITPTLLSLYQFCTMQLIQANIRLDTKRIDDVIRILDGIRSAYAQIVTQEDGRSTAANISAQGQLQAQASAQAAVTRQAQAPGEEPGAAPAAPPTPPPAAPKPAGRYGLSGLSGMAMRKGGLAAPQGAPQIAQPVTAPPVAPPPPAPPRTAAPAPEQAAPPPPAAPTPPPAAPQPPIQPKLRTAFNAAKFRAANAYNSNS
ncbi:flagellar export chaperone FliS [Pseudodesulfovibrio sp.]|uniref:flagellar export chaperone FliS n=1 Tax=Pseudodesulfovibrio sp. TaxID=2035812 RepID=UPI0026217E76|nr:flagellar export chaperone FliS [Pseudodesulfovibrio sp.]MDD3313251.1 flagellar export chaperone FliS [Pseudodesulfovibrio sp.]